MRNGYMVENFKVTKVANYAAASTTDVTSSVLDMTGFDSVVFIAFLGTVTDASDLTLLAYENTASSTSSPTPTAITDATTGVVAASTSSNKHMWIEIKRNKFSKRYVFCKLVIDTQNAAVDNIIAIQYDSRAFPVSQPSALLTSVAVGS